MRIFSEKRLRALGSPLVVLAVSLVSVPLVHAQDDQTEAATPDEQNADSGAEDSGYRGDGDERGERRGPPRRGRGLRGRGPGDGGPRGRGPGGRGPGFGGPSFGGPGFGGPELMLRLPIVAALDADGDGVISKQEIENAASSLKALDKNEDGQLDLGELRPQFGPRGARPDARRRGGPDTRGPRRGPGGRGPGGFADRSPEAILERLMQRDRDGDGLLAGDELLPRMERLIERADGNGDEKLSRQELGEALEKRVEMMRQRRGRGGDGEAAPGGEQPRRPPRE